MLFNKDMNMTLRINSDGSERNSHDGHVSKADADALYLLAGKQAGNIGISVRKSADAETNCHWEVPIRLGTYAQAQKSAKPGTTLPVLFRYQSDFAVPICY
jgi:hypothetical protein